MSPVLDRADMPPRIRQLPLDERGYPVPWFVATIDGKPDFRVIERGRIGEAIRRQRCWVCGGLRAYQADAFVIGPMCAVNRNTAEPPSHPDCAEYSARHCPFLTIPRMRRRDARMPEEATEPAGTMIRRNPGVALVWRSRTWKSYRDPEGGILFDVGDPVRVAWFAEGREASRDEVMASIDSGLPSLREIATDEGPDACAALDSMYQRALELVPA